MRIGATKKAIYRGLSHNQIITIDTNLRALTTYSLEELFEKMTYANFRDDIHGLFVYSSWVVAVTACVSSGNVVPQNTTELNDMALRISRNWWRSREHQS